MVDQLVDNRLINEDNSAYTFPSELSIGGRYDAECCVMARLRRTLARLLQWRDLSTLSSTALSQGLSADIICFLEPSIGRRNDVVR